MSFVWYELAADDADAAQAFYRAVIGLTAAAGDAPGVDYRILSAPDGDPIGGLLARPAGSGEKARWLGYVGVEDVDAQVDAFCQAGGTVHLPAVDMPGVGRIAMVGDPQGAMLYLIQPDGTGTSRAFQPQDTQPGHVAWNELSAPDPDAALAFYAARLGWRQDGGMPMGDLGEYRFLRGGDTMLGALMGEVPGGHPGWLFYFQVPDIDAAVARITQAGGACVQGPDEIPGGSYAVVAEDPQGARFGLVGPRVGEAS